MLWKDMEFLEYLCKQNRTLEKRIADLESKVMEESHWRDCDPNEIIQKGFEAQFSNQWFASSSIGCTVKSQEDIKYRAPKNLKPIYQKEYFYQGKSISRMTMAELQDALIAVCGVLRYDK